uniref:Exopolygalacturonase n=1 Tax=Anthurium amnicola TaxID=1678845 RepID=A0A1D1YA19_9ARAE
MAKLQSLHLLLLLVVHFFPPARAVVYNIVGLGARADGWADSSSALLRAWGLACRSPQPATVYVPAGRFLLSKAAFSGPCRSPVTVRMDGTLVAPSYYGSSHDSSHEKWIEFDGVDGLSVYGGVLDGRGAALWTCKASGRSCPAGITTLTFSDSKNVAVSGLTSINSKLYHVVIHGCRGVSLQGVQIVAPGNSPNTDGIHVQMSTGVTVTGAVIRTGDDCVSIGPGTTDLWIERVSCGPGHGISIGSLGKDYDEEGVQNVTVRSVVFTGTENGVRIKSWGRPSTGFVRGVAFEHALMRDVENPIIIDQNYCPHNRGCPNQKSGVQISQVRFYDIHGSSATQVAVKLDCSQSSPCRGIGLQDIKLTYGNRPAQSLCEHVVGTAMGTMSPPSCL